MDTTKFAQLFILLSQKEAEAFLQFIELPYLKVPSKSKVLFNSFYASYWLPKENPKKHLLSREELQRKHFADQDTNFHQLNKSTSNLHFYLQQFLALESARGDKKQLEATATQVAINRGAYHYASVALNRKEKELEEKSGVQLDAYSLAEEKDRLYYYEGNVKRTESLQQVEQKLDDFYFITKLKNQCLRLSRNIPSNDSPEKLAIFETYLEEYKKSTPPSLLFQLYDTAAQLLKEIAIAENMQQLRRLMEQFKNQIPPTDAQIIRDIIFTHYTLQFNHRKMSPKSVLTEFQGLLREKTLVAENGGFQTNYYRNIVAVAIQAKDATYARQFSAAYKHRLEEKDQENVYEYSLGTCDFAEGNWREAMNHAEQVEGKEFKFSRGSLLLRSAFEYQLDVAGEWKIVKQYDFERIHTNFMALLRRHPQKQRKKQYTAYKNFADYIEELNRLYFEVNDRKEKIEKLQEKVMDQQLLVGKSWLLEKIKEI